MVCKIINGNKNREYFDLTLCCTTRNREKDIFAVPLLKIISTFLGWVLSIVEPRSLIIGGEKLHKWQLNDSTFERTN
jgi:hypothetical protein